MVLNGARLSVRSQFNQAQSIHAIALSAFLLLSCQTPPPSQVTPTAQQCSVTAAALDVGSGSTKYQVFELDSCQNGARALSEGQIEIGFSRDLERPNSNGQFSEALFQELEQKGAQLARELTSKNVSEVSGFATAAFRKAGNAERARLALIEILNQNGISVRKLKIIEQSEEAKLGLLSALDQTQDPSSVVWDIGGGSMQISRRLPSGELAVWGQPIGAQTFLAQVRDQFAKSSNSSSLKPHLGLNGKRIAEALANSFTKTMPSEVWKRLQFEGIASDSKEAETFNWLGIGGVWNRSVRNQLKRCGSLEVTQTALKKCIARQTRAESFVPSDPQFKDTEATNLIFVLAWMKSLKIQRIEPIANSVLNYWIRFCHADRRQKGDSCPLHSL